MRIILLLALVTALAADSPRDLARSILAELIGINTTDSEGDNTRAAEAMAKRLLAAGYPAADVQVVVPAPKKGNLVARLRGTGGGRPILVLSHLDVVEARRSDWTLDPFTLTEKDGYFYGRGTQDIKGDGAILVANFIRLKQEGFRPQRDLILALTADEEGGRGPNGVQWLLGNRRDLIDAEFCVNTDAGGGQVKNGRRLLYSVQAAEKGYETFLLRAKNPGGHSSLPVADNAIYHLADALMRIRDLRFPEQLNPITKAFFERMTVIDPSAATSDAPYYNALRRTTCVATMLNGGHAENALPQTAEAKVNCRLVPGDMVENVRAVLGKTVAGTGVEIDPLSPAAPNPFSPLPGPLLERLESVVHSMWPGVPVVPVMETGGTDGKPLRAAGIPTYGMSALFIDLADIRAHGQDERIPVGAFYEGADFNYRLLKELSKP